MIRLVLFLFLLAPMAVYAQNTVTIDGDIMDWYDEFILDDPQGCDDDPGQKDVVVAGAAVAMPNIFLLFFFDVEGLNGMNTGDGCWLVDIDGNGNADKALCFTLRGNPFTLMAADVVFYDCNNSQNDRCSGSMAVAEPSLNCALDAQAAEIPGHECGGGNGSAVECSVSLSAIGWVSGTSVVLSSCSFPSAVPNSAPSDCVSDADIPIVVDPDTGETTPVTLLQFGIE